MNLIEKIKDKISRMSALKDKAWNDLELNAKDKDYIKVGEKLKYIIELENKINTLEPLVDDEN